MKGRSTFLVACLGIVLTTIYLTSCQTHQPLAKTDSPLHGTIHISADESFKPIIDEQVKVYENSFPGTHIIVDYKSEAACIRDILQDSATRMVIVTRPLDRKENKYLDGEIQFTPSSERIADDAIAVVVGANSNDSMFTMAELSTILQGKAASRKDVVFDGLNATSIVRYAKDSLLKGQPFDTSLVKAEKNSRAVIDYVAGNPNAIGFVGISWIGNPEDSGQVNLLKKVKLAYIRCDTCEGQPFVKPSQLGILTKRYPLIRGLYYILKENYTGLGSGFASFLQYEQGQLIFRRAYLAPTKMGFAIRDVKINQRLKKD